MVWHSSSLAYNLALPCLTFVISGCAGSIEPVRSDQFVAEVIGNAEERTSSPGSPPVRCRVRSGNYLRELARAKNSNDTGVVRDLAAYVMLLDRIDAAIRTEPSLRALQRKIDKRLAALGRQQAPDVRAAFEADQQRYRRSLMRDKSFVMGDRQSEAELIDELRRQLRWRLGELERIRPFRKGFTGMWSNVTGDVILRVDGDGRYELIGRTVDPYFLAWTCELDAGDRILRQYGTSLFLDLGDGEAVSMKNRNGVIVVEHRLPQHSETPHCGAGGSLGGIYFPVVPIPAPPTRQGEYPPYKEFR